MGNFILSLTYYTLNFKTNLLFMQSSALNFNENFLIAFLKVLIVQTFPLDPLLVWWKLKPVVLTLSSTINSFQTRQPAEGVLYC